MSGAQQPTDKSAMTKTANAALVVAGAALIGMAAVQGWQVFARYVLNNSPSWTEPVALLLMSTTMMLGAAVGVRREAHFGFFIGVESAPPSLRSALRLFARLIVIGIGGLFTVLGAQLALDAWSFPMAGVPLPQGVIFLPVCIGGALIVAFSIERIVDARAAASNE
jgi:TRAP-type C4-dicarboxylate transport system permease small subunit